MRDGDLEAEAESLYRMAGLDPDSPPGPAVLARRILGPASVRHAPPQHLPGDGALARVRDSWRIYVRAGLTPERLGFAVAHELAEHHLARIGYRGSDIEERADRLGAAILAPRGAIRAALAHCGDDVRALAHAFVSTQSWAAMRTAEVTGAPTALVSPAKVRVRGQLEFVWGSEQDVRALATKPRPGIHRARLTDDRRRTVLKAL